MNTQQKFDFRMLIGKMDLYNIEVAYDTTDHFSLICPICHNDCIILKVKTIRKMQIDFNGTKDNCTYLHTYCPNCKKGGQRKIYWDSYLHKGRSKIGRTNWKEKVLELKKDKEKNGA